MPEVELKREGATAYREAIPQTSENGDPVLLVHGFPQSSYMWAPVVAALAASGRRAIAPDLSGYGDSAPDPPGTWERHVSALETFRQALGSVTPQPPSIGPFAWRTNPG
jgi:pimeloyl-ACP methyl ester carboxylesterase